MCRHFAFLMVILTNLQVCMFQLPPNATEEVIGGASYQNVTRLYENILIGYDRRVKPRKKQTDFVTVNFLFRILGITEFDTASQKLSILGFFYFQWRDDMLSWEPKSYGGIKVAKLPLKDIWSLGMMFMRDLQGTGVIGDDREGVILANTGDATWTPAGILNVICDVKTKFYPFDRQSCVMSIYAADASSSEIRLLPSGEGVGLEGYQPNSEWNLVNVRVENVSMSGAYFYEFIFDLERRTEFLIYTVVSPLVLLSILNVGIFIIPIDSGEKGSIAVTLFLSYGIFVTAIKDELPHNSVDVSHFLIYIQLLLIYSVFTVLYCFVESWVFSVRADDTVTRCCFKKKQIEHQATPNILKTISSKFKHENVDGLATSSTAFTDSGNGTEIGNTVTWRKLLRWIDISVMLISVCVVSMATSVFFYNLSCRSTF